MRLLCVTHYFPIPADMGGPIRVLGLIRALAAEHTVHLLATRRAETRDGHAAELERSLGITVEAFAPPQSERRGRLQEWAHALRRGAPPWILAEISADLDGRVRALAPNFDALVILDDYAGAYVPLGLHAAPITIADKPVVLGAAFSSERGGGLADRARDALAGRLTRSFERRYLERVDAVVVTSEEEAARYERLYGTKPEVVVSAIDLPSVPSIGGRAETVGWIGSLDGRPIVDGLRRFVETAWNPLGEQGCELLVAGRRPPASIRALERHPGVKVIGYVEDLGQFLDRIGAAVIPLWDGRGIKLKTLTLLAAGVPVAATPVALEGIPAVDGRDCLIAEQPEALASALQRLISDRKLAAAVAAGGRRLMAESYTWDSAGPRFVEIVEGALERRTELVR